MKRIISLLLACILMLQALPLMTFAADTKTSVSSVAELRKVAKNISGSKTHIVNYKGSKDLVIDQDLKLPKNLHLYAGSRKLVVNKGVTFRSGAYMEVDSLEVKGKANTYLTHVYDELTVKGELHLLGTLHMHSGKTGDVEGVKNIYFDDGSIDFWMSAKTTKELLSNIEKANSSPQSWYRYRMSLKGEFAFTKSVTVPYNCYLVTDAADSVTINSGCTLITQGRFYVQNPLIIKGKLENMALITVSDQGSMTLKSGGRYNFSTPIQVESPIKPSKVIKGLGLDPEDYYTVKEGSSTRVMPSKWWRITTLTAKNVSSSGKIKLSWNGIADVDHYEIHRAAKENGKYELLKTVAPSSTSYTTGGTPGKTYYYKVRAVTNTGDTSEFSDVVKGTIDLPRPDVSIKLSKGDPKLSWDKVDDAKEYTIYRATKKDGTYKEVKTTTKLSWTDTDAKSGKTYYYKVKALHQKSAGNSASSSVVSIKTK